MSLMSISTETDPLLTYENRHFEYTMDSKKIVEIEPSIIEQQLEDELPVGSCLSCCSVFAPIAIGWLTLFGFYLANGWDQYIDGLNWNPEEKRIALSNTFKAAFVYLILLCYVVYKIRDAKKSRYRYEPIGH